jgi:hypothetical protein
VALLDFLLKLTRNHERDAEFAGIGMEARQGGDALRLRLREPGPEGGRPITKAKFYFMIAADSTATFGMGNSDGEKDDEDPSVDEGGRANAEGARTGKDKDNGDRAQTQAELCGDAAEGIDAWRDAGDASEETGMKANCPVHGH